MKDYLEMIRSERIRLEDNLEMLRSGRIRLEDFLETLSDGIRLKDIPEEEITEEICWEALRCGHEETIAYVPREKFDDEIYERMCLEAVKYNLFALEYVPEEMRTEKVCLEAVKRNRSMIEYVPEKMRTEEMCLEAIKEDGWALEYVPEGMRTKEMCLKALMAYIDKICYLYGSMHVAPEEVLERGQGHIFAEVPEEIRPLIISEYEEIKAKWERIVAHTKELGAKLYITLSDEEKERIDKEIETIEAKKAAIKERFNNKTRENRRKAYAEELGVDLDSLSQGEIEEFDKEIEEIEERKKLVKQILEKKETIKAQEETIEAQKDAIEAQRETMEPDK